VGFEAVMQGDQDLFSLDEQHRRILGLFLAESSFRSFLITYLVSDWVSASGRVLGRVWALELQYKAIRLFS
jgi:hypothetical protein